MPDNPTLIFTFDTPIEPSSVTDGGFFLVLLSNGNISYQLNTALSADQKTVTVTLAPGTLPSGVEFQMRINYNGRLDDWAGNAGSYGFYYFTTQ